MMVPLGKQSDAVGSDKNGLMLAGREVCRKSFQTPVRERRMKMHGSQGAAGSARRHMPVQGAGSKELVCPDSPGKRQSVVATEQRVSSRVGEPGAVLPISTMLVPGSCSAHLNAAASPVLEWHLSCMGESRLWGLEPPTWLVAGGTLLLMPSTLLFVVCCSR